MKKDAATHGQQRMAALIAAQKKAQKDRLQIAALMAVIVSAAAVLLLGLAGWFIASAAIAGGVSIAYAHSFNFMTPSAGIRGLAIARTASRYAERLVGHVAALKSLAALRPALFAELAAAPPDKSLAIASGDASARLVQDIDAVQNLFVRLSAPWGAAAALIAGLALAVLAGWQAALVVLCAAIAAVFAAMKLGRALAEPAGEAVQHAGGELKTRFASLHAAAPELRAYGLEDWAVNQVGKSGALHAEQTRRLTLAGGWIGLSQNLIVGAAAAGAMAAASGSATPLAALAALAAVTTIEGAAMLAVAFRQNGASHAAVARLGDMIDGPEPVARQTPEDHALRLSGPHMNLAPPQRLAISGASGAGKTSLIERLMHLRTPMRGEASIGGVDICDVDTKTARSLFAYAPQDVVLISGSLRQNLKLARPDASDAMMWAALADAGLEARVKASAAGLDMAIGENGERLSGGERRRVGLARAYLRAAPWLVLDEPTEGLDAATEALVLERLNARLSQSGQGLILISHRPAPRSLCEQGLTVSNFRLG